MSVDPGVLYRTCRERITALVSADGIDESIVVMATPEWNVHDVIAHLSGIAEDAISGNMEGVTSDPWTAAQVERGRGRSLGDLIDQWTTLSPLMEAVFSSPEGASRLNGVFDVHTHEADLRTALGLAAEVPADFLGWAAGMFRYSFAAAVANAGLPEVTLEISDFEWFRGRLGRRTEAEVRAYPWPTDPTPYLDPFFIFGRASHSLGERP